MRISSLYQNTFLFCCIVALMPLSNTKAIEENSDVYLDEAKEVVPCEGDDRGDRKCNHDRTHRVCAKLVDNTNGQCKRLKWGTKDFWEITDQVKWEWSKLICSDEDRNGNPKPSGENWCICMWATERLINKVGCDNVHFECDATDVNYILGQYLDRDVNGELLEITNAKCCMLKKCPSFVTKETKRNLDESGLVCPK